MTKQNGKSIIDQYYYPVYSKQSDNFLGMLAKNKPININADTLIIKSDLTDKGSIRFDIDKIEPSPSGSYFTAPCYLIVNLKEYDYEFELKLRNYLKIETPNQ